VDVLHGTFSAFPTVTSITGGDYLLLSNAQKNTNPAVSLWTTTLAAGDVLQFGLLSASGVSRLSLCILVSC
jgi:hypothetical protein